MAEIIEELAGLDRRIHEPARLAVLTILSSCTSADFLFLQRLTGLTTGNLSSHLAKLEEGGFIEIKKAFNGKIPRTRIRLTDMGRGAIDRHWQLLERLHAMAQAQQSEEERYQQVIEAT
jgi:DNA-binding MarR family transcriptional regulator